METKELIFNGKKFFEGTAPNYIGKTIKAPKKEINIYTMLNAQSDDIPGMKSTAFTGEVFGQMIVNNRIFLIESSARYWFALDELLQNGGVSASYITTLCSRKELVA